MALDVNKVVGGPAQGLPIDARHEQSRHAQEEVRSAIAAAAVAQEEERARAVAESDIGVVLRELASVSIAFDRKLQFSINEKLGQVVVKVIDGETDKVIKEIPPAEIQRVHERIREVIGILFDERA